MARASGRKGFGIAKRLAAITVVVAAVNPAAGQKERQSQRDFEAALANDSTSPSFILFTVVDGRTGEEKTGCILAPFLLGAIHIEHHLAYSRPAMAEGLRIAEAQSDHRFLFRDP